MTALDELRRAIIEAAGRAVAAEDFPPEPLSDYTVFLNDDGNYSTKLAEKWALEMDMTPLEVAETIKKHIFLLDTDFSECLFDENGVLTFTLL